MSLPENKLSTSPVYSAFLGAAALPTSKTTSYTDGGIGLADTSEGLTYQVWKGEIVPNNGTGLDDIWISADNLAPYIDHSAAGISELSIAFNQNMVLHYAYVENGEAKLHWYDSTLPGMVTTSFGTVTTPRLTLDDKRDSQTSISDIVFAYLRDGDLYHRLQRDRFEVEYLLKTGVNLELTKVGMNLGNRLQFMLEDAPPPPVLETDKSFYVQQSAVPTLVEDVYTHDGTSVKQVFEGWQKVDGTVRKFYGKEIVSGVGPLDLGGYTYTGKSYQLPEVVSVPTARGLKFNPTGTKMYVSGSQPVYGVGMYTLSVPWDVTTATPDGWTVYAGSGFPKGMFIDDTGTNVYIASSSRDLQQHSLSVAWDTSTPTLVAAKYLSELTTGGCNGVFVAPTNDSFIVTDRTHIREYTYTGLDITTAVVVKTISDASPSFNYIYGINFTTDGLQMVQGGQTQFPNPMARRYTVSTPFRLIDEVLTADELVSGGAFYADMGAVFMTGDGAKMFVLASGNSTVYEYAVP